MTQPFGGIPISVGPRGSGSHDGERSSVRTSKLDRIVDGETTALRYTVLTTGHPFRVLRGRPLRRLKHKRKRRGMIREGGFAGCQGYKET